MKTRRKWLNSIFNFALWFHSNCVLTEKQFTIDFPSEICSLCEIEFHFHSTRTANHTLEFEVFSFCFVLVPFLFLFRRQTAVFSKVHRWMTLPLLVAKLWISRLYIFNGQMAGCSFCLHRLGNGHPFFSFAHFMFSPFFLFDGRHVWSIQHENSESFIFCHEK